MLKVDSSSSAASFDVLVVGAGYTGLAVAKALQEDGRLSFRVSAGPWMEATDGSIKPAAAL